MRFPTYVDVCTKHRPVLQELNAQMFQQLQGSDCIPPTAANSSMNMEVDPCPSCVWFQRTCDVQERVSIPAPYCATPAADSVGADALPIVMRIKASYMLGGYKHDKQVFSGTTRMMT